MSQSPKNYDIILIGSGIGALTVASVMAQYRNKKILILERHYTAGGFTHVFRRKRKFFWDVGIHYIGDLGQDSILNRLFAIISRNKLTWQKMPEVFEKFVYPDFTFPAVSSKEGFERDLISRWPDEEAAIHRYFDDIKATNTWWGRQFTMKGKAAFADLVKGKLDLNGFDHPNITTKEYLDKNFRDEKLKAVLCSQWGDYGLPPSMSSFLIHSTVVQHYLNGGYYVVGGSGEIFDSIEPIIREKGGEVLVNHEVQRILLDGNRAVGVRVKNTRAQNPEEEIIDFHAPVIISNAGAWTTYKKLLPENHTHYGKELEDFYNRFPVVANVTLYLGLKDDPRKLGFRGENHWIYSSYDHDKNFAGGADWVERGEATGAYLSFPSLKDPKAESFTAEVIAFSEYAPFARWKDQPWKKRDEEYKAFKEKIAQALLRYIDSHYPGFSDLVEFYELSTPITTEHFTMHPRGSIYGVTAVTDRFNSKAAPFCNAETPINGLYLTGADVSSPGVAGAMMGGVATLSRIPDGLTMMKIMRGPEEN